MGVLISLQQPTKQMRAEAASAHRYRSPVWQRDYAGIQLCTITELLEGKRVNFSPSAQTNVTYKKGPPVKTGGQQQKLLFVADNPKGKPKRR